MLFKLAVLCVLSVLLSVLYKYHLAISLQAATIFFAELQSAATNQERPLFEEILYAQISLNKFAVVVSVMPVSR